MRRSRLFPRPSSALHAARGWCYCGGVSSSVNPATQALALDRASAPAYVGLTLATAGWAVAFVVGKLVLSGMTPLAVAVWRYAVASAILAPFFWRDATRRHLGRVAGPLLVMIVAGGVLYPWLFLEALARTTATNTSLLIALNPVFTVLLAPLVGEPLTRRRGLGLAIAFGGAVVVITRGDLEMLERLDFAAGDLLAIAAGSLWAIFNLASRRVLGVISPSVANFTVYATSALALFAVGFTEAPVAQLAGASASLWGGILVLALVSSVLAGQLFLSGVRAVGVSRAVLFIYLVPVLTAGLAAVSLGERFSTPEMCGALAVLAGVALASRPDV